ncbi:hypothetical protein CLOM_g10182, partial [Closterium sp. NIES-68]
LESDREGPARVRRREPRRRRAEWWRSRGTTVIGFKKTLVFYRARWREDGLGDAGVPSTDSSDDIASLMLPAGSSAGSADVTIAAPPSASAAGWQSACGPAGMTLSQWVVVRVYTRGALPQQSQPGRARAQGRAAEEWRRKGAWARRSRRRRRQKRNPRQRRDWS